MRDRGTHFAYSSEFIRHYCHDFIEFQLFLVLKRIEMFGAVDNSAKNMTVLLVIVKLDIDLERSDVSVGVFHKELLHSLNENRHACFSEDL